MPEALWLGLVIDHCGYTAARGHCSSLGQAASAVMNGAECPMFVKFSTFAELSDAAKEAVISALNQGSLAAIRQSLAALAAVVPDHPLAFLGKADALPEQNAHLPKLLREFYDRNSRTSVLSMALGHELGIDQGKIHIAAHLVDDDIARLKVISDYPKTEESRRAAGAFRASAPSLFMAVSLDDGSFEE